MNRKFFLTVLTAGFILFLAAFARAETRMIGSVSGGSLKLRSTTSTSADNVVGSYSSGTQVNILSESGNWYFVEVNGQFGYMMSKYIKVSTEYEHMGWGIVEEENAVINVFSAPDPSSKVMYKCLCGARFEIVGHENGWYRVRSGHDFGYIIDKYLIPTDTS